MRRFIAELTFLAWIAPLIGCSFGGEVTNSLSEPSTPIFLLAPTISIPASTNHYSNGSSLQIAGVCNNGYTVELSGSDDQTQPCVDNAFSFTTQKLVDGIYPYLIRQKGTGADSPPKVLFWIRKTSVTPPTVTQPATNPFRSGTNSINLSGGCESGSTVSLEGDGFGTDLCENSSYSIPLTQYTDGTYTIRVKQTDLAGNSASQDFVWQKESLITSPSNSQIVVGKSQVFTVTGGSGTYTIQFLTNASGATLDPATKTYTAGTVAGVTDVLRFEDSLGIRADVPILTMPDRADHFEVDSNSGDGQTGSAGDTLPLPIKVKVVDRFGNAVGNYSVLFRITSGDSKLLSAANQISDASGLVQNSVRLGTLSTKTVITIRPSSGLLPDEAGSGNTLLQMVAFSQVTNKGEFGSFFPVSSSPTVNTIRDINKDGKMDLAVLNSGEPSIGLLLGKGGGLFESMIKIRPICVGPSAMAVADLNGDTWDDFAVSCSSSDRISIVLSTGDGSFQSTTTFATDPNESLPVAIAAEDINNDGKKDLLVVATGGGVLTLRLGQGDGTFGAPSFFNVGLGPSAIRVKDINNDSFADVVIINSADNNLGLFINDGAGAFYPMQTQAVGVAPASVSIDDMDSDGREDLTVVNNADNSVETLINDGFGGFWSKGPHPVGNSPASLAVQDLNGDSRPDLVVSNVDDSTLSVLLGRGDGTYDPQPIVTTLVNPIHVSIGLINGDAFPDVVVTSNADQRVQILTGQGDGRIGLLAEPADTPVAVKLADINEDGKLDLLVISRNTNTLKILEGNGLGLWTERAVLSTNNGPTAFLAEDLDGDGHLDLAVTHQNSPTLRLFFGLGDFSFAPPAEYGTGTFGAAVTASDLNGDGLMDLAVANAGANSVSILANAGSRNFLAKQDFLVGQQPVAISVADINGDLEMDILVANQNSGSISALISNGGIDYQSQVEIPTGAGPNGLVVGFFNGDNKLDVAVANELDNTISVLIGVGDGSFQTPVNYWAGLSSKGLMSADLNGDGRQDLVVGNGSQKTITILFGGGAGTFGASRTVDSGPSVDGLSIGDVNKDGTLDLIGADSNSGQIELWWGH